MSRMPIALKMGYRVPKGHTGCFHHQLLGDLRKTEETDGLIEDKSIIQRGFYNKLECHVSDVETPVVIQRCSREAVLGRTLDNWFEKRVDSNYQCQSANRYTRAAVSQYSAAFSAAEQPCVIRFKAFHNTP